MLNIVITMGGIGSRFQKAGYTQPKYKIETKGRTLFEWSLISLESFRKLVPTYIFIVKSSDQSSTFITESCHTLGLSNIHIIEIEELTDGQATTALFGESVWDPSLPLLIFNIDTHIEPEYLLPETIQGEGWIPCFQAPGESWSFVKLDAEQNAVEVREKKRVSDFASVGIYWFSSAQSYSNVYKKYYSSSAREEKGEKYVAPLYNQLIAEGKRVTIVDIPLERVHVLGTPEELTAFNESLYSR
ncbi:glycosyltransferase family 2 protein [Cohnella lubricantis]|uniref:Glycosyltransferase family 2 protein n=1 Tax=Cohnella lubricantis TaxID=2163172 RepID=A0A841TFC6_9BACL|nr:glycosyltransferase family 2 protein [Cohnella lubricantis]MBB6678785.1 glycosyltransferase family 2 protein [Cohnella lubricantis]MBP2117868.1 dTDP-glucose pyrophosphorylase [Cohnella lubricantis]